MFLDIGIGILLSIFGNIYFHTDLTIFFVFICILFALSPDIDYLIYLIKKKGKSNEMAHCHRDILHYPLIFIPSGMLFLSIFSKEYSFLFGLGSFLHFLHDSIGIGWGIRWFWPFSKNYYAFFRKSVAKEKESPIRFICIWEPEEVKKLASEYGDPNWFKNIYLRPSLISITEFTIFLISLLILYLYLFTWYNY